MKGNGDDVIEEGKEDCDDDEAEIDQVVSMNEPTYCLCERVGISLLLAIIKLHFTYCRFHSVT